MSNNTGYDDGDCKLVLTPSQHMLLHSGVLIQGSATFRELLDDMWIANPPMPDLGGSKVRHKLVLIKNSEVNNQGNEVGYVFEPRKLNGRDLNQNKRPAQDTTALDGDDDDLEQVVDAYVSVLGCFYNSPIDIGGSDNVQTMLAKAIYIADVAEYLQCIPMITAPIESAFLALGQPFHLSIASSPRVWLIFAYRIRSYTIFKEALIHAAGKFRTQKMQEGLITMPEVVSDLVKRKAASITRAVKDAERKIASFYPTPLKRNDCENIITPKGKDPTARASYGNDILLWMGLSAFRQLQTTCILDGETNEAIDMGYGYMLAISKGGDAYLPRGSLQSFHKEFPMSPKGMAVVEFRVNEIKEQCRQYAKPLVVNRSQLNTNLHKVGHFTCTEVTPGDYPWVRA